MFREGDFRLFFFIETGFAEGINRVFSIDESLFPEAWVKWDKGQEVMSFDKCMIQLRMDCV